MNHLVSLKDWPASLIQEVIRHGLRVKRHPAKFSQAMRGRTLLMLFEKPSLRTRVSFEVGMEQMGGHAIYYDLSASPAGKGKESIADLARTVSRYVDIIMARTFEHATIEELARYATVPVINGLSNFSHPCQILGDLMTLKEKKKKLKGLKLAYLGDAHNNVTHSLLFACPKVGVSVSIGCPKGAVYEPHPDVLAAARHWAAAAGTAVEIHHQATRAVADADVVYTDSWMSYHIPEHEREKRYAALAPFQVTSALMRRAKPDAVFMHCLPAQRGVEQTAEVIDGPQSIVFDQAENRLHIQKAIILKLLGVL
ncbi:MAG: ornithine carbamoyltransferase [Acidobacteriota bacterium]|nr:ornithine carbamoyltransferase [Blastocatellia bacterium]MDW8238486.1 ornithine carbamoyltransferase [Acidobacteriota bacterium]